MASQSRKRDIADFFKPHAQAIPAKRLSPTLEDDTIQVRAPKHKHNDLQTPSSASRFKDEISSPHKSPFGPGSATSLKMPIRSPMPTSPVTSFSSTLLAHYKDLPLKSQKTAGNGQQQHARTLSFANVPSSTQQIVKDGKVIAVRGSDDDDSDSLASLDDIFGRNTNDAQTSSSSPPELDAENLEAERERSLFLFTSGRSQPLVGRDKLRELNSKAREQKFDISKLIGEQLDDEEAEGYVAKAREGYEASKHAEERLRRQKELSNDLLASVMNDTQEGNEDLLRLLSAMERTEALIFEKRWSFFRAHPRNDAVKQGVPVTSLARFAKRL